MPVMPTFSKSELMCIALLMDEEEAEERIRNRRRFWVHRSLLLRNIKGEFHTLFKELLKDEEKFAEYFRMSFVQFRTLFKKIKLQITKKNTTFREAVSPVERLAVCLRFLATGNSFRSLAFSFRLGESTVRKIVKDVCQSIVETMKSEQMPIPTKEQWEAIADEFWQQWNFPNCLGAMGGKHVQIKAPANSGSLYLNYKNTFSIVLLALADADYKFIAVDVGPYGNNSDGGIFANSTLGKATANYQLNVPEERALPGTDMKVPFVMVADEAFPLRKYILRPYPGAVIDNQTKRVYNYRLSGARRVVENTFGIMFQKFRIYDRRLNVDPDFANLIVLTTCVMHNFLRGTTDSGPHAGECHAESSVQSAHNVLALQRQGGFASSAAFAVRETFASYFMSPPGAVEWQNHA